MCARTPDYEPEIYMASHYRGMKVDCYFTNGDICRYDISTCNRNERNEPKVD